jgi:hypothetical protein
LARVSPTTIQAAEKWGYLPGRPVRQRLASALGVRPADIWPDLGEQGELALSAISDLFDRHIEQARRGQALPLLKQARLIEEERVKTSGISRDAS